MLVKFCIDEIKNIRCKCFSLFIMQSLYNTPPYKAVFDKAWPDCGTQFFFLLWNCTKGL